MAQTFLKPRLMRWNNVAITDHNRASLAVTAERIEKSNRMADGTTRKYVIADKLKWSVSWDDLPNITQYTVDGFLGGRDIKAFWEANAGSFNLEITDGDLVVTTYAVVFTDFSYSIKKRGGKYDMWQVDIAMEQV